MSILFVAAKFSSGNFPFDQRVALLRSHYEISRRRDILEKTWLFPEAGIALFAAEQNHHGRRFSHISTTPHGADIITHAPFGYSQIASSVPVEKAASALAAALDDDPSLLLRLHPPQAVISVDERARSIRFRNDLLGLGKTFLLRGAEGVAISNRPIAAHLMAGIPPEPSDEGWAAEQLHGWFIGELSPFRNTRRLPGGTVLTLDGRGVTETRHALASRWFTEPMPGPSRQGFDRFLSELREFADLSSIEIGLSGGRDSRASAAVATHLGLDRLQFRTNEPPKLEVIIARQLIERLPNFQRFGNQLGAAIDMEGRKIWKANAPKIDEVEVHSRARTWARLGEGVMAAAAIYAMPPASGVFSSQPDFRPSISGIAGESAKAYYWSPNMVSGAYAKSLKQFREDIASVKVNQRMQAHPLTTQSAYPFIQTSYRPHFRSLILASQQEATAAGIHGYRFLDYWWFTDRMGAGTTVGFSGTVTMMPFMAPEFIAEGLQGTPVDRARGGLLSRIAEEYRPEWAGVPYFDEVQNSVPRDQVRYYRDRSLLWEGELAPDFMEMLRDSPAFSDPYDREAMLAFFSNVTVEPHLKAGLNVKALGLVHRHAFVEMCREVGAAIRAAGDGAEPQPAALTAQG